MTENYTLDLFAAMPPDMRSETLAPGAMVLRGFALSSQRHLLKAVREIVSIAPFRRMETPGGLRMSVAMSNCGALGWLSDRRGYRYDRIDPLGGTAWPAMPATFLTLARDAAAQAGFHHFSPDACLLNRYEPGTRLSLHQDKDELDFYAPIVSVSLGLPAVFLFGGDARTDQQQRVPLAHGDVVVWGGPSRLRFHGVLPLKDGCHDVLGTQRLNLTFRQTGFTREAA